MRGDGRVFLKRGSRYWHAEFWVDGEPIRCSTHETDRESAERVLKRKVEQIRAGAAVPGEDRLTLLDLFHFVEANYRLRRNRSIDSMRYSFRHLLDFFGARARATKLGVRTEDYVEHRRSERASEASIRIELSLLDRGFILAVQKKLLANRNRPHIEKPAEDLTRVRRGFFTRDEVERLCSPCACTTEAIQARSWPPAVHARHQDVTPCWHLPPDVADLVRFLFFSAWRVNEGRALEWRHYFAHDGAIRLPAELSKNKHDRALPVDRGELAIILTRRLNARRLHPDCPFIFHRNGQRIRDFRKVWTTACEALGFRGRIVHDLRRSGVKHLIDAGIDPHTVMAFSGHRTPSMLQRYHIIDLDDLRRAAERATRYSGAQNDRRVTRLRRTRTEPAQSDVLSSLSAGTSSVRG